MPCTIRQLYLDRNTLCTILLPNNMLLFLLLWQSISEMESVDDFFIALQHAISGLTEFEYNFDQKSSNQRRLRAR
jgi:hypothetical protein